MTKLKAILAVVAIAAIAAGGGFVGAAYGGDDPTAQPPDPQPDQTISEEVAANGFLGGGANEDLFVPITPCRIVDTRKAGGSLQVGGSRVFDIRGNGGTFAAQGGRADGCDIPGGARAIEATITTIDSGSGFLRAYPAHVPAPNATFMNYTPLFNVSNTGTLAINGCGGICVANQDLRLRAYGSATHAVVEVNGYYMQQMGAVVYENGILVDGNRVSRTSRLSAGRYEVGFDRDISECSYSATPYTTGAIVVVAQRAGEPDAVYVRTYTDSFVASDTQFYLEVTC